MHILVSYSSHALKVVQVIGVTGAGKTTFVNTVTGENSLETNDDVNSGMYLSIPLARPFFFLSLFPYYYIPIYPSPRDKN